MPGELPNSTELNIGCLVSAFKDTSNSYKFLWFKAILELLKKEQWNKSTFSFDDLCCYMLAIAWIPSEYFKLNLGVQDQTATLINSLKPFTDKKPTFHKLVAHFNSLDSSQLAEVQKTFTRYVPFRFISSWFSEELRGLKDSQKNRLIQTLSRRSERTSTPLYSTDNQTINLDKNWLRYLRQNLAIIEGWVDINWAQYLQRKNPSVTNILFKLKFEDKRESFSKPIITVWDHLSNRGLKCIYSNQTLKESKSIDHYLPWSFVAHNEPWNLVPVSTNKTNINSSKGNALPSEIYLPKFLIAQEKFVTCANQILASNSANKVFASYSEALHLTKEQILKPNLLKPKLEQLIRIQSQSAELMGFSRDWIQDS